MKEIKLTNSDRVALVDDPDYELVNGHKWYLTDRCYAQGSIRINGITKAIKMHRLILGLTDPKVHVDHINHNRLDNRRSELRLCTHKGNNRNRLPKNEFKGVYVDRRGKHEYIKACIKVNGRNRHLGSYSTKEDAAHAYDIAAKKYFGEFANLNFKQWSA